MSHADLITPVTADEVHQESEAHEKLDELGGNHEDFTLDVAPRASLSVAPQTGRL